ncbi:hypothetical protein THRCLA_09062 [Thraustotheca clavata]|uniref:Uncharacterized protein n=1 Tax=Thraustotheca clavata TaxID=74557 RepID=A0A1V9YZK3_9STRA|nr:hypothetical protein THRCLA_09062 [Thraustotheca clavata]
MSAASSVNESSFVVFLSQQLDAAQIQAQDKESLHNERVLTDTALREQLEKQAHSLETVNQELTQDLLQLKHELTSWEANCTTLRDQNQELQRENDEIRSKLAVLLQQQSQEAMETNNSGSVVNSFKRLQKDYEELKLVKMGLVQRNITLNDQNNEMKSEWGQQVQCITSLEQQNKTLQEALSSVKDENESLTVKSEQLRKENDILVHQNAQLINKLRAQKTEMGVLELNRSSANHLTEQENTVQHHNPQLYSTPVRNKPSLQNQQTFKDDALERQDLYQEVIEKNFQLRAAVDELEKTLAAKNATISNLERDITRARQSMLSYQSQKPRMEEMQRRDTALTKEIEFLKAKVLDLTKECQELQNVVAGNDKWSVQLRQEMKNMHNQFEELTVQKTKDLRRENNALRDALANEKGIVAQLKLNNSQEKETEILELQTILQTAQAMVYEILPSETLYPLGQESNELLASLSRLRQVVRKMEHFKLKSKDIIDQLRHELSIATMDQKKSVSQQNTLHQELLSCKLRETQLENQLTSLQYEFDLKSSEVKRIAQSNESFKAKAANCLEYLQTMEAQNNSLKDKYTSALQEKDNLARSVEAQVKTLSANLSAAIENGLQFKKNILTRSIALLTALGYSSKSSTVTSGKEALELAISKAQDLMKEKTDLQKSAQSSPNTSPGDISAKKLKNLASMIVRREKKIAELNEHMNQLFQECISLQQTNTSYAVEIERLRLRERHLEQDVAYLSCKNRKVPTPVQVEYPITDYSQPNN